MSGPVYRSVCRAGLQIKFAQSLISDPPQTHEFVVDPSRCFLMVLNSMTPLRLIKHHHIPSFNSWLYVLEFKL